MVLGFETVIVGEVTEWDPPRASSATASGRPVKSFRLRETFEPTPTGTRVVRDIEFELPLPLRLLWPVSARWSCVVGGRQPTTSSD